MNPSGSGWQTSSELPVHHALRCAVEHLLSGISEAPAVARFAVRGGWCFALWPGDLHRATADLDLVDLGGTEAPLSLLRAVTAPTTGVAFDWAAAAAHRVGAGWTEHLRVAVRASVRGACVPVRINLASGVRCTGHVERIMMRSRTGRAPCIVPCVSPEWLASEKAALLVTYGGEHSRLRDIFDLWELQGRFDFAGAAFADAFRCVAKGRDAERLLLRRDGYWEAAFEPSRVTRPLLSAWEEVTSRRIAGHPAPALQDAFREVGCFLTPVLRCLRDSRVVPAIWRPGRGWDGRRVLGGDMTQQPPLPFLPRRAPRGHARRRSATVRRVRQNVSIPRFGSERADTRFPPQPRNCRLAQ